MKSRAPLTATPARRLPIGAEPQDAGVHFRVWAPSALRVDVIIRSRSSSGSRDVSLEPEADGYFAGLCHVAATGDRYQFRLDGGEPWRPASRFQPEGPHGPSEIVDPGAYAWKDADWPGLPRGGQVISEIHVGTYTPEGTYRALAAQLEEIASTGITTLELMPLAEFPGTFGWGYDGVSLFAPYHHYGNPDDLRYLIDRAHALGLGIILDVVYNHLGPDGNYLPHYARSYFSREDSTDWGTAINFGGTDSAPVREFFLSNVKHWISEYHLDGLRLDATQNIYDRSPRHILIDIAREARKAAGRRSILLVAENETQDARLVRPSENGGFELDMLWNDDFHHSAVVALTGRTEAYYHDYRGGPQELVSAVKNGFLFQGQWYRWQRKRRGHPALDLHAEQFVNFLENHDQIANPSGKRVTELTAPASLRALTAYLLLAPGTPLLFQGQEFGSSRPFHFFADHQGELARKVFEGRKKFLRQFASAAASDFALVRDPADPETFRSSKLDFEDRKTNARLYRLHRDLLRLRRETPAFVAGRRTGFDGAVLGATAFLLRWFAPEGDRLLLVNLGADLWLDPAPAPLLAPPEGSHWQLEWSSEDPQYGGLGTPPVETDANWQLPGRSAVLLRPGPITDLPSVAQTEEDVG